MPSSHRSADHAMDSRRTRKAVSALNRVAGQRAELATTYAAASDSRDRLYAAAQAVRAATGDLAARQTPPRLQARAAARLDAIADQLAALAAELLDAQQATASRLLTAEQTRATENHARNGRRARHDGRPGPERPGPGAPTT